VDHERLEEIPARVRLAADLGERLLRHARVVLERHRADRVPVVRLAHEADEARHGPDVRAAP
jgi:hypothetical protein